MQGFGGYWTVQQVNPANITIGPAAPSRWDVTEEDPGSAAVIITIG